MQRYVLAKLLGVVAASMLVVAAVLVSMLLPRHLDAIDAAQVNKAVAYGRQGSLQLEPAVAFDDPATAREILDGLARDEEVIAATVLHEDGRVIHTLGESFEGPRDHGDKVKIVKRDAAITVVVPISAREGPRGWLEFQLGRDRQLTARAETIRIAGIALAASLALGLLGAFLIARPLVRRVRVLTAVAEEVAGGNLEKNLPANHSGDEVGRLHESFARMLSQLRKLILEREEKARTELKRLDGLVEERTQALGLRRRENQLVLDNISQGLLLINADGTLGTEHSKAVLEWFGVPPPNSPFWAFLGRSDDAIAAKYKLAWEQVAEGFLPVEMCLDQFPRALKIDGKTLRTVLSPIEDDAAGRMLLVIEDVTDEFARLAAEAAARELAAALHHICADRHGFLEFVSEATRLINGILLSPTLDTKLKRDLHTLKGNAGMFGLERVVRVCHDLENELAETGRPLGAEQRDRLRLAWTNIERLLSTMGRGGSQRVEVDRRELRRLAQAIDDGESRISLQRRLRMFEREPAKARLERIAEQARALAARSGVGDLNIQIDDGGLRLDGEALRGFWSTFPHVVRNALSHAFESTEERVANGKPPTPSLTLRAGLTEKALVIEAIDDGRGINWAHIARAAAARGLSSDTKEQLTSALFAEGVTTRERADTMSGRGEGMGAVKEAVESLGGEISLCTESGRGTTFRFSFAPRLADVADRFSTRPPALRMDAQHAH